VRIFNWESGKEHTGEIKSETGLNDPAESERDWAAQAEEKRKKLPKSSPFHHIPELDD
jgi:hypothetical protein